MLNLIKKKSVIFCYKLRLKQKEITKRKKKKTAKILFWVYVEICWYAILIINNDDDIVDKNICT